YFLVSVGAVALDKMQAEQFGQFAGEAIVRRHLMGWCAGTTRKGHSDTLLVMVAVILLRNIQSGLHSVGRVSV
ncbi:MAG TPA: hypothetical protein DEB15_04725, partial [Pusillimonas sp.]|nr:hypothetical protein [Pusillimonas sp.]